MDLAQYIRIFRLHWLAILMLTVLGALLGLGWALLQPKVYEADATGTVTSAEGAADANSALLYENLANTKVKSYLQWAKTRSVAKGAADELGISDPPEQLVKRITVENPVGTPVINVTAEASSPSAARDLATAWLNALSREGVSQAGGDDAHPVLTLRVTESASLPSSPSSPNLKLAVVVGLLLGGALGIAYAVLKNMLDKRIRTADQVEREFAIPVIGTIPTSKGLTEGQRLEFSSDEAAYNSRSTHSPVSEAMRQLRTNLQFVNVDNPPRAITVTSPLPGEGKSTVAANLAVTIASAGERVILVDADLRKPTVANTFSLVEGFGLTDVLAGQAEITDVLQPWGATGNMFVLGAGKTPPNPSELLNSNAMKTLIAELAKHAFVVVDAPPLIPVTDSAILATKTDGLIVVVRAGKTKTDALLKAQSNLERVSRKPVGVILNQVPLRGPNSGYYGYNYTYYGASEGTSNGQHSSAKRRLAKR